MRVELLYWDGDPSYMTARQRLVAVLTEDAFETSIQMIAVSSAADAEFLSFSGSPTIRIDGQDIYPEGIGAIGLYLRVYPLEEEGSVEEEGSAPSATDGAPGKALIRAAVERARGWGHGRRR
jgi:hypothetical protein